MFSLYIKQGGGEDSPLWENENQEAFYPQLWSSLSWIAQIFEKKWKKKSYPLIQNQLWSPLILVQLYMTDYIARLAISSDKILQISGETVSL